MPDKKISELSEASEQEATGSSAEIPIKVVDDVTGETTTKRVSVNLVGGKVSTIPNGPSTPSDGQLWYDEEASEGYIWLDSLNGWVQFNAPSLESGAVTSESIAPGAVSTDKLSENFIEPSGGLEIGAGGGLKIATSAEALSVILRMNSTTGVQYTAGVTHVSRESDNKTVTDKFISMSDVYSWLNSNISTTGIIVDVIVETDITEGTGTEHNYIVTNGNRIGHIRWWGVGIYNQTIPSSTTVNNPVITINVDQTYTASSRVLFWFANQTSFRGINFVINFGSQGNTYHTVFRTIGATLAMTLCKVTVTSSNIIARLFESIERGLIRMNVGLASSGTPGHEDPLNRGARSHAVEVDITGCTEGISNIFDVSGSSLRLVEYRPGADTDLSGFHFTGNGTATFTNFMYVHSASDIKVNTNITRSTQTTISCGQVFSGLGYNTINAALYTEQGTGQWSKYPGAIAYASGFDTPGDYVIDYDFGSSQASGPVATNNLDTEDDYL